MMNYKLKYLFKVIYNDDSEYNQTENDISLVNPEKSCYYDVKLMEVKYFILSDGSTSYTVDLKDGGFSIDGSAKFYLSTEELSHFEPYYFRRIVVNPGTEVYYFMGYKALNNIGELVYKSICIK